MSETVGSMQTGQTGLEEEDCCFLVGVGIGVGAHRVDGQWLRSHMRGSYLGKSSSS